MRSLLPLIACGLAAPSLPTEPPLLQRLVRIRIPGAGELVVAGLPIPPSAPVGFLLTAQAFFADVTVTSTNPLDIYIGL